MNNKQIFKQFWRFVRADRNTFAFSLLLMFSTLVFDLMRPFLLKLALDQVIQKDMVTLHLYAGLFLSALVLEYFSRSGFNYLLSTSFLKTIHRMRNDLFAHVLHLKIAYFDHKPVGNLLTRTVNDTESIRETLRAGIATVVVDIFTIIGVFLVMMKIDLRLSPVMLITLPLVLLLVRWFGKKLRDQYLKVRKALARSNAFMAESIGGIELIRLFNYQKESKSQFASINREYRQATIRSNVYDASLYACVDGIAFIVTGLVLYWGLGIHFGLVEISVVVVYLNLIERIFIPIRDVSGKFATIQQAFAALQRIFSLLNTTEYLPQGNKNITGTQLDVHFENVNFAYQTQGPLVLKNISFSIASGQVVALVGTTGSGKSTIGKLLTRAYAGYTGHIRVGDVELGEVNYHSLRSNIAVVHQDAEVFPATLRDNITMFDTTITDDKIYQAIRMVHAEDIVGQINNGLDFMVSENGANLSAGQLQLIVFARALAYNAPIILMDEATSSVDSVTEAWIQRALQQIFACRTVLVVAHRLSTIAAADNILVLSEGRIIQQGNHQQLIADAGGHYAQLIRSSQAILK